MSSALKTQIQDAMKAAMKAGDKPRLAVVRLMLAAIKQVEVDERIELDDTRVTTILDKMIKQRRESISQYGPAGRNDLVAQEQSEIDIIQTFLPQALSTDEIETIINTTIKSTGASSIKDMGRVMGIIRPQVVGRADMGEVSNIIKSRLNAG
jgi:uncharacterized protein YqeY